MSLVPLPLDLASSLGSFLSEYKPSKKPFVTLMHAQAQNSKISNGYRSRTVILHEEIKNMAHYLHHHDDEILGGTGTVLAGNLDQNLCGHLIRIVRIVMKIIVITTRFLLQRCIRQN